MGLSRVEPGAGLEDGVVAAGGLQITAVCGSCLEQSGLLSVLSLDGSRPSHVAGRCDVSPVQPSFVSVRGAAPRCSSYLLTPPSSGGAALFSRLVINLFKKKTKLYYVSLLHYEFC